MREIAERWLSTRENGVGAKTFHRYTQIVEQYIVPEIGAIRSDQFRPMHIESLLATWRNAKIRNMKVDRKLSDRSIRHNFDTLRTICRWAARMSLIAKDPCEPITPPSFFSKKK